MTYLHTRYLAVFVFILWCDVFNSTASAQTLNLYSKGTVTSIKASDIRSIGFDRRLTIQSTSSATVTAFEFAAIDSIGIVTSATVAPSSGTFTLLSSAFINNGELPKEYTCDGASASPPLNWSNPPAATKSYAIIMDHIVGPTPGKPGEFDRHTYLVLYNIPPSTTSIPKNVSDVGLFGINTVNSKTAYSPPCSAGPGTKLYTLTLYALSAEPTLTVPQTSVTREILLAAIKNITLGQAVINVNYTR